MKKPASASRGGISRSEAMPDTMAMGMSGKRRQVLQRAQKIPAVHDGHVEVEKNHARMNTRAQKEKRLGAAFGSDGAQTFDSEEVDEPLAQRGVVVDHQDVRT